MSAVAAPALPAFEALHLGDRLQTVNPAGDVGLITLWSPWRTVRRKLEEVAPDLLDRSGSRIAVAANLYGDGMYTMFCNLLFNPQVRHLVAVGEDLGLGVPEELEAFLRDGLEDAELLGGRFRRIRGTSRLLPWDEAFDAERLRASLSFRHLGRLSRPGFAADLRSCLDALPVLQPRHGGRVRVALQADADADPGDRGARFAPSDVQAHQVVRPTPLACWEELVVRCMRFGRPVDLPKGRRLELLNVKAVIGTPAEDPPAALAAHGFSREAFRAYEAQMLDPQVPEGVAYTYGQRLRGGGTDALASVVDVLRADPDSRQAVVALWDTATDLAEDAESTPCLTTVVLRRSGGRLALTATYRAHNLLRAWLPNVYGLMAVQRFVGDAVGLPPGALTVISHSLGITPASDRQAVAEAVVERWASDDDVDHATGKRSLRADPHGYFVVSADHERGVVVAEHRFEGTLVKRYEAARAVTIEAAVAADMAVSLVSHALWLGRQLTRAEEQLRAGR